MNPVSLFVQGVLLPGLIATVAALIGSIIVHRTPASGRPDSRPDTTTYCAGRNVALFGVALSYFITIWMLEGGLGFPPKRAFVWLPYAAVILAALGSVEPLLKVSRAVLWRIRLVILLLLIFVLTKNFRGSQWDAAESAGWFAAFCAGGIYLWGTLGRVSRMDPPWYGAFVLSGLVGGTAMTLGLSGSVVLAQASGALAVALLVLAAAVWHTPRLGGESIPTLTVPLWLGMLFLGYNSSAMTVPSGLLCLVAAVAVSSRRLHAALEQRVWWVRLGIPLALMGLLLGGALLYSYMHAPVTEW